MLAVVSSYFSSLGFENGAAFAAVAESINDLVLVVQGGQVTYANPAAVEWWGLRPPLPVDELLDGFASWAAEAYRTRARAALGSGTRFTELMAINDADGEEHSVLQVSIPLHGNGDDETRHVTLLRHVRPHYAVERRQEGSEAAAATVDSNGKLTWTSGGVHAALGVSSADLEGASLTDLVIEGDRDKLARALASSRPVQHVTVRLRSGRGVHLEIDRPLAAGVSTDRVLVVKPQKDSDDPEDLRTQASRQAALAEFGQQALREGTDIGQLLLLGGRLLLDQLGLENATVVELLPEDDSLVLRVALRFDLLGTELDYQVPRNSLGGYAVDLGEPVVSNDLAGEDRFMVPDWARETLGSGIAVPIRTAQRIWGTLVGLSVAADRFETSDVDFAVSISNLMGAAIDRLISDAALAHLASHDPLTGLGNRVALDSVLAELLASDGLVAACFVDLDDFKDVNDSLGHTIGDRVLVEVASRLLGRVANGDTLVRFGGDEFVVVLSGLAAENEAIDRATDLLGAVAAPIPIDEHDIMVRASVGVALRHPGGRDSPESLVRDADVAMYQAKRRGKGCVEVFDQAAQESAAARLVMERALHKAIEDEALQVHYQPIVRLGDHQVVRVEALARWFGSEDARPVPPDVFIPLAERTGLISAIGAFVLRCAENQLQIWDRESGTVSGLGVSVNISPVQLIQPSLLNELEARVASGCDPARIELEVTENVLIADTDRAVAVLAAVRDLGYRIAVDDFGTGYSSLRYLKQLPIDSVKIDRSFIAELGVDEWSTSIVRTVIELARLRGLDVIAEGVETADQVRWLKDLGCEYAQGYFFARPAAPDTIDWDHLAGEPS